MAYEVGSFDPKERIREKQASRDSDELMLGSGQISPAQLRQQNSFFAGFDLPQSVIQRRSVRIPA